MIIPILIIFSIVTSIVIFLSLNEKENNFIFFGIGVVLILTATFRDGNILPDYIEYIDNFKAIVRGHDVDIDLAYIVFSKISFFFTKGPYLMFLAYAILGVTFKMLAMRQLTDFFALSVLMYVAFFYSLHELIQIRAGVAAGLLLLSIKPLYDRDWKRFFLYSIIAVIFHFSALLILPLWLLNAKKSNKVVWIIILFLGYLFLLLGISIGSLLSLVMNIENANTKFNAYLYATQSNTEVMVNIFNIPHLFRCTMAVLLVLMSDYIAKNNKYVFILVKIYIVGLFSYVLFSTIPVVAFRISEFYSTVEIILIPLIVYIFHGKCLQRHIGVLLCSIYMFFAIYLNILL